MSRIWTTFNNPRMNFVKERAGMIFLLFVGHGKNTLILQVHRSRSVVEGY
jgi:hypothetical protein